MDAVAGALAVSDCKPAREEWGIMKEAEAQRKKELEAQRKKELEAQRKRELKAPQPAEKEEEQPTLATDPAADSSP